MTEMQVNHLSDDELTVARNAAKVLWNVLAAASPYIQMIATEMLFEAQILSYYKQRDRLRAIDHRVRNMRRNIKNNREDGLGEQ